MKNLKKLLSMVLVIALAVSLMATVSAANVSDYSDADDVTYTEAVDLFTALGFLAGMGDGTFDPTGLVTREQAAKIITYMLIGSARADALTTTVSDFTDVATDRWSAPFIQYCATLGIINGMGDGTYNPTGNVTGAQFAKMLLCAVGYGVNDEYTGANWAMKTIADATNLGILSLNLDYSAPATREEVSQYGFNAYAYCNTVVWNSQTQAYQQAIDIDGVNAKGSLAKQQGVNNTTSTYVSNGTSYYRWTKMGAEITSAYSKDVIIGTSMDGTSIADLSDYSNMKYIAALQQDDPSTTLANEAAKVYYNGKVSTSLTSLLDGNGSLTVGQVYYNATAAMVMVSKAGGNAASATDVKAIAKGSIVKFINTDFDAAAEVVQVITKQVTKLVSDPIYNATTGKVTITSIPGCTNIAAVKVPDYDTFKANDVILWYLDNTGVYNIEKATSVSGTVSSYASGSVTLEGASYTYSGMNGTINQTTVQSYIGLPDTTLYLDDGGYVVYASQAVSPSTADNYLFLSTTQSAGYTKQGYAILSDGTALIITIDPTSDGYGTIGAAPNAFYKFAVTSTGSYVLKTVAGGAAFGSENVGATDPLQSPVVVNGYTITKGAARFLTSATDASDVLAGSSTRFVYLYQTAPVKYFAYTGISSVPTFTSNQAGENIYVLYVKGMAVFVYAENVSDAFVPSTVSGDWVYIMNGTPSTNYVSSTVTTRTYEAIVNNEAKPVTVDAASDPFGGTVGLYQVTAYNADGYVTLATPASTSLIPKAFTNTVAETNATSNLVASGGTITLMNGGTTYYYATSSSVVYHFIDASTIATTGSATTYTLSAAQVNALVGTFAISLVETSSTDHSIAAVYIYSNSGSTFAAPTAAVPTDGNAGGLSATTPVLLSVSGTTATYSTVITGTEIDNTSASTLTLTSGTWASSIPAHTGIVRTSGSTLWVANATAMQAGGYTVTFTVPLTATTPAPALTVGDDSFTGITSSGISVGTTDTTLTITLTGGTFDSTVAITDFSFANTESATLAAGTLAYVNATTVTITYTATGTASADTTVTVLGSALLTPATAVTAASA